MSSLFLICVSFYIFCAYVTLVASKRDSRSGRQQPTTSGGFALPESAHSWAMYTPYYPLDDYVPPPQDCEIDQVNILQRHGARYPTKSASKAIKKALKKLQGAKKFTDPQMYFLHNFTYSLGKDDLVPFGAAESYEAGEQAFWRYADLISKEKLPFVRASSKQRVVDSATNWTAGFAAASHQQYAPVVSVILSESANDTLDDANCPNAGSADAQDAAWQAVYAPNITAALNAYAPGADLDDDDTASLISLCPFETVANMGRSGFCGLFEQLGAFAGYEYAGDVDKYYGTGYGQALGRVQGVGYVNELLARLTDTPVRDATNTNRTLDGAAATFPLGRTVYADFSHDNEMIAVYAALGLFPQAAPLSVVRADPGRTWRVSRMVPFAARMVVEKMACGAGAGAGAEEYVRVLVNQAVQPLGFCGADADGLCSLDAFVDSQAYARNNGDGDWEKCFS